MVFAETFAANHGRAVGERLKLLNSTTWAEEIAEVLESARQAPADWRADPDWRAASHLLVRHCQETLSRWS